MGLRGSGATAWAKAVRSSLLKARVPLIAGTASAAICISMAPRPE